MFTYIPSFFFFNCFLFPLKCFPGGIVVKNPLANAGDAGDVASTPGSGRAPGVGNGNPLLVLLLREFRGQRSLVGYSPWGRNESARAEHVSMRAHTFPLKLLRFLKPRKLYPFPFVDTLLTLWFIFISNWVEWLLTINNCNLAFLKSLSKFL